MKTRTLRTLCVILCEAFALVTLVLHIGEGQASRLAVAGLTLLLILVPEAAERLLHCRLSTPVYLYTLFYSLGPMLGHCYHFYQLVPWWDKLLHISGGVMFALLGLYLFARYGDGQKILLGALFALCFSMAVAVAWEFVEFGADCLLGTDMQNDTVITAFHSYLLGDALGELGGFDAITEVSVNGTVLPGYLDVGLRDTMLDMLLESLGALTVVVIALADRGRHAAIRPLPAA